MGVRALSESFLICSAGAAVVVIVVTAGVESVDIFCFLDGGEGAGEGLMGWCWPALSKFSLYAR